MPRPDEDSSTPPRWKRILLKLSGEIGQVNRLAGKDVRVFDRFFAGGLGTVRGFESRSLGPRDSRNFEAIGGQSLILLSTELVQPVVEGKLYTVVFADAGNVWAGAWDWQVDDLNVGVGVGLRVVLPVGTIVLDYGWPVRRTEDWLDTSGRVHFNIGYNLF